MLAAFDLLNKEMQVQTIKTCTTGGVLFAEGPRHSAKAQKSSVKALSSAALGKEASEKNLTAKRLFAKGYLSGTRQSLFRVPMATLWQRKAAVNGAAPLTAPLPSADS